MALQVWLPLNGTKDQLGLSGIAMSGNPASYESDGPINQAATFTKDTSKVIYNTSKAFDYLTNFSVAFWVKNNYDSGTQYAWTVGRADAGGYGYGCLAYASNLNLRFGSAINYSIPVTLNTWTHLVMTVSQAGDSINFYKDGTLYATVAYPSSGLPTYSDGNGLGLGCFHYSGNIYPWKGSICDFRIYNHVLSLKEIQQIYQRLFLHYELNHSQIGNPNLVALYRRSGSLSSYSTGFSSTVYEQDSTVPSGYHVKLTIGSTTGTGGPYWVGTTTSGERGTQIHELVQNDYYTVSFLVKSNLVHSSEIATTAEFLNNVEFLSRPTINTQWQKVVFRGTYNGHTTSGIAITIYEGSKWTQGELLYLSSLKVEAGKYPTPYMPYISEPDIALYTVNNNIEHDTSGYCHNGTIMGSPIYTSETPRYYVAPIFNSCAKYIYTPKLRLQRPMTWCCWYKHDGNTSNSLRYLISEGRDNPISGFTLEVHSGYLWTHSPSLSVQSSNILTAGWHHCCAVLNESTVKVYVDGELKGTLNSSAAITYSESDNPMLVIGKMSYSYTSTSSYFSANGAMSDVRIYKSALSADDVKELYNTSMIIDSSGNILPRVLTS